MDSSLLPRCLAQEGGRTSSAVPTARVLGSIHSHSWTEGPTNPLLLLLFLRASVFVTSGRTHRPVQLTQHVRFRVCLNSAHSASSHIRWKITEESGEEMWSFAKCGEEANDGGRVVKVKQGNGTLDWLETQWGGWVGVAAKINRK